MANLNIFAGIDISKDFFDITLLSNGTTIYSGRFTNDPDGFTKLCSALQPDTHCVMEATGPYYLRLACWLHKEGFLVSVVNPLVIRRFAQMQLRRVKTDKADAAIIAQYGSLHQPQSWSPPAQYLVTLQQLDAMREKVIMQITMLSNQLEAFTSGGMMDKEIKTLLNKMIRHHQKMLQQLDNKIEGIIMQHHKEMLTNLTTIPGIAKKTASLLITVTSGSPGSRMQSSCVPTLA